MKMLGNRFFARIGGTSQQTGHSSQQMMHNHLFFVVRLYRMNIVRELDLEGVIRVNPVLTSLFLNLAMDVLLHE